MLRPGEPGYTYDGRSNAMLQNYFRDRLDRVFCQLQGWRVLLLLLPSCCCCLFPPFLSSSSSCSFSAGSPFGPTDPGCFDRSLYSEGSLAHKASGSVAGFPDLTPPIASFAPSLMMQLKSIEMVGTEAIPGATWAKDTKKGPVKLPVGLAGSRPSTGVTCQSPLGICGIPLYLTPALPHGPFEASSEFTI